MVGLLRGAGRLVDMGRRANSSAPVKAVIFDMGGVLVSHPKVAWRDYEKRHGLEKDSILSTLMHEQMHAPFYALERGETTIPEFEPQFTEFYASRHNMAGIPTLRFLSEFSGLVEPVGEMAEAVGTLRASGLRLGLLTNNFWLDAARSQSVLPVPTHHFHSVVESCRVGLRKPSAEIYRLMMGELGVGPEETVFLDDLGHNLKAAAQLGIRTIKVAEPGKAVAELEAITGLTLNRQVHGTIPVRRSMAIPVQNLLKYLKSEVGINSENEIVTFRQFQHGQSNPTYYLQIGDKKMVLRKKPPGKLLPSAHQIGREYRVMSAVSEQGVPIPRLIHYATDASVIGTEFYLMEYVEGRIFKDPRLRHLGPRQRREIYTALNTLLAKIHSVDLAKGRLLDYGKHENYLERQLKRWGDQYEKSKTGEIPSMDKLTAWLRQHIPEKSETTLVHGDFRLDNVIFHPDKPEVLGVLDWELSTIGDPLTDVASALFTHFLPSDFPILQGMSDDAKNFPTLGIPTEAEFLAHYDRLRHGDATPGIQERFQFYVPFCFFRFVAILQGVYKRALGGQASSAQALVIGEHTQRLADVGWDVVQDRSANLEPDHTEPRMADRYGQVAIIPEAMRDEARDLHAAVRDFVTKEVIPAEEELFAHAQSTSCWTQPERMESLKAKAKAAGLWNLFIPASLDSKQEYGKGLTNLEYAHICEQMGRSVFAPEVFNCSAPDTGNMEVLLKYGSPAQKDKFLRPLLQGTKRSCFAMTEPAVASSDATNIEASITRQGDKYILNGRKWYISGAMHPDCSVCIFMGKTDRSAPRHRQQSMIVLDMNTPGVSVVRPLGALGFFDAPGGHAEVLFEKVAVPAENLILGEGRGFEIAQGRLGPGRIHHCMRLLGNCERAMDLFKHRALSRVAFGGTLWDKGTIRADVAHSRVEIEQARLLVLKTAHIIDQRGNKAAAREIAMIKVAVPNTAQRIMDRAIQAHGAMGVSQDTTLAPFFVWARVLRIADGPDEVHLESIAKSEIQSRL